MIPPRPRDPIELTTRDLRVITRPMDIVTDTIRVIVAVSTIEAGQPLARCLASIAAQRGDGLDLGVIVLFDGREQGPVAEALELPTALSGKAWILMGACGSAARSRNTILEFVEHELPTCRWVARLDHDDAFATCDSLAAAVELGERVQATAVLGGNRVVDRNGKFLRLNPATSNLLNPSAVLEQLVAMAEERAPNELPSCNLVTRVGSGLRYPDKASAEDHWLVATLLVNRTNEVAILESPIYADYAIEGSTTVAAKTRQHYREARQSLAEAAREWLRVRALPGRILGLGQEAIVREHDARVFKHFYRGILDAEVVEWLRSVGETTAIPATQFFFDETNQAWTGIYGYEETEAFADPNPSAVREFLSECLRLGVVCTNIKRSNFRVRRSGQLVYIDVGNTIIPMDVSYLRDAAARLYAIGVLGWSDAELLRRKSDLTRPEIWERLPGFADFYGQVVGNRIRAMWASEPTQPLSPLSGRHPDVTLLIKACAMDARHAWGQITHIVDQLCAPVGFAERVLLVDTYAGPFLREHDVGDLGGLLDIAEQLVKKGFLDRILLAPSDDATLRQINRLWFGVDCAHSHSHDDVPVTPQVWGFDQMSTRFVLQCDLDVLIGRRRRSHDYLAEMLRACEPNNVVCVAFNIPQPESQGFRPYGAPPGEYKPEVRLGLLDLNRLQELRPLPAKVEGGRLMTTWYRSLHVRQKELGLCTVRGGDPDTFYLHPPNARKGDWDALGRIRDLVAQGFVPEGQVGRWDLEVPDDEWRYPVRNEAVVVLARGRNTPVEKVRRFVTSLAMQDDQSFGVVVIDDASDNVAPSFHVEALSPLGARVTLVRRPRRMGYMPNNLFAISTLCGDPSTLIVIVDLDDALADPTAIRELKMRRDQGHDVILAAPFRPDAPTRVYHPCFERVRETFGGDVWIHLRAFKKALFDALPAHLLMLDAAWLETLEDYATMVPIAEMASSPVYVPRFLYWHERSTILDRAAVESRDRMILRILAKERSVGEA